MFNQKEWMESVDVAVEQKLLTPTQAFIAYHIMQKYADWTTGKAIYCSKIKMSTAFGMSNNTVINAFAVLENLGFMIEDPSRKLSDGRLYYDLALPTLCSEETGVCSECTGGCAPSAQGVCCESTQTTNITTKLNNEDNNQVSNSDVSDDVTTGGSESAGQAKPASTSFDSPKDDIPFDPQIAIDSLGTESGVCSQSTGLPRQHVDSCDRKYCQHPQCKALRKEKGEVLVGDTW